MTSGRRPRLLAGILALLRGVADEIVVAVEAPRADDVHAAIGDLADVVLVFPPTSPADRPIPWLFESCSGTWIFNIDDDEVPSPALVAALPEIVSREDITHGWVARRWLYPTQESYLAERPWGTEYQLRLALADDRFLQFSDVFHRPLVCHGPSAYIEAPLWHLDAVVNPAAKRRLKAAAYESERPGMRIEGRAHNLSLYVPELVPAPRLLPVPPADRDAIEAALAFPRAPEGVARARIVHVSSAEVERGWVGAPYPESLYHATLAVDSDPGTMLAGSQHTVDVRVTNESEVVWRWGRDARPEIRLAYQWLCDGELVDEPKALRTTLPADLPPGETLLAPVHVVAPEGPGSYTLEIDLVHEHVRWFGRGVSNPVTVRPRERIAVIARAERVPELLSELRLDPDVEPIVVLRDQSDRAAYGDYESVAGPRGHLLSGGERTGRLRTLGRVLWRTLVLARRCRVNHWSRPACESFLDATRSTEWLVIDGANWEPEGAFGREWLALAGTALLWRRAGRRVLIPDEALPLGSGLRQSSVRWTMRRLRSQGARD
ncbi:MAG TPA: hypothetical protein VM049_08355 [Gaiellaceae bacterium]|nr:hypothetical protein [Gaiellaceae bacterium]